MDAIPTNTRPGQTHSGGGTHWFIWALFFLMLAYVFSPAPLFKLCPDPPYAVLAMYIPLGYLYDHVPPVKSFYDGYGELWGIGK